MPPAPVVVTRVLERELSPRHTVVGTVMPLRASTVGSAVSGRVEDFLVNEGDRVRKGQAIARLRTGIIAAEVANAVGEMKMRKAEVAELEAGSRPEEKEQARARLDSAAALSEFLKAKKQRAVILGRSISPEELQEISSLSARADAAHAEAHAALKLLEPRREKLDQARAKLEAARAEVERLQEQLDRHTVYAPFDGYVVAEHTEVGQWVLQGAAIAELAELDQVEIEVHVLEDYASGLRLGQGAKVALGAFPGEDFSGQVSVIVPRANMKSRTLPVRVRLQNRFEQNQAGQLCTAVLGVGIARCPLHLASAVGPAAMNLERTRGVVLKAGLFARVTLPVGQQARGLVLPRDALVLGGSSRTVYVFDPDPSDPDKGKVRPVPVEVGREDRGLVEVRGDLRPGQLVVIEGNERVRPGQDVAVLRRK
jgi:multidrug efflux pump subunit AcrA (membrane-fusion protein)